MTTLTITIPTLETERLILRAPKLADLDAMERYGKDPRSAWNGGPFDRKTLRTVIFRDIGVWALLGYGMWHIALKDSDAHVGFMGVIHPEDWPEPELGWGILAEYEGKGLAFEAGMAARRGLVDLGIPTPPSYCAPDNMRSQALAARMGATREDDIILRGETAQVWRHPEVTP